MANDPGRDIFPTKEARDCSGTTDMTTYDRHLTPEKRFALHLSRTDLEDQFYKFKEENFQLKKATKKQEEELKKLATKMTRLLREKKSMEINHSPGNKRDLELEEMVEDLQDKVRQLERTNNHLREKAIVAKQQVIMQARRPNPYSHVPPKVNSGNLKSAGSPYFSSINLRGKQLQNFSRKGGSNVIPPFTLSLLEEARTELSNLKMLVTNQRNEIEMYLQENEVLKHSMRMREIEFEEELNGMKLQQTERQRQHVQKNLDLIRLHRELKQKSSNILSLQAQYSDMVEKMRILKLNHDHLIKDMDDLALRFKNEQKKNLELLGQLQKAEITFTASSEFQEQIKSLKKENDVLRETNDKLMKSVFAHEQEKSYSHMEQILKERISSLENSLEEQTKAKHSLQEVLIQEKGKLESKEEAYNMLQKQLEQVKSSMEDLEKEIQFLKSENLNFEDLQEALNLLKLYREGRLGSLNKSVNETQEEPVPLQFNELDEQSSKNCGGNNVCNETDKVEHDATPEVSHEVEELKAKLKEYEENYHETLQELQTVRDMLTTQCNLNQTTQEEMKTLSEKVDEQQNVYKTQLEEYTHLLDIRATRIQKLEKQLNDIAYGTTTYTDSHASGDHSTPLELSKGENIFEIHLIRVEFSKEGLKYLMSPSSKVFLTWNFYEYELQSTPVVSAEKPVFNFTVQYTVEVDDFFLCYLHENTVRIELHESHGMDFKTVAAGQLDFSSIFSKEQGKVHVTQKLIGSKKGEEFDFGIVEFWIQLKLPMEDSFKYFKEKMKALKYIQGNKKASSSAVNLLQHSSVKDKNANELHIKILRGIKLKAGQKGVQPSPFCVYKFFDLPDQDTTIIPSSNNPEFSYHCSFPMYIDQTLQKYLNTENLYIYVFDDNEQDITTYIGRASIPLQSLVKNKPIKGIFELYKDGNPGYGSIEVLIYWQCDYSPPVEISSQEILQHISIGSSSDSEDSGSAIPSHEKSTEIPPVPKPRTKVPSKDSQKTVEVKTIDSSSSDHTYNLSHNSSSESSKDESTGPPPQPAKRRLQTNGEANLNPIPHPVKRHQSDHGDDWSDVMSDTERRASFAFEETDQEKQEHFYNSNDSDSDSEDYSITDQQRMSVKVPKIVIRVSHLQFRADAAVLKNSSTTLLYVEYRFLDYPLEELETPFSLPKKGPPDKIEFNFEKEFLLKHKDLEKWNLLSKMVSYDSPECGLIKFTVVSEPPSEDQSLDCEDVGFGTVDIHDILKKNRDIVGENIPIVDARDSDNVIGSLNITIQALDALHFLQTFIEF